MADGFTASAMNSSRLLVGRTTATDGSHRAATLQRGILTEFGTGPGTSAILRDVNDSGVAVGAWWVEPFGPGDGFAWRGGPFESVPMLDFPEPSVMLAAVNETGQFAGTMRAGSVGYAARWDPGAAAPVLLSDVYGSSAHDINDHGEVAGTAQLWGAPVVWRADGTTLPLEPYPGLDAYALTINNAGEVAMKAHADKILYWNAQGELTVVAEGWGDITFLGIDDAGRVYWAGYDGSEYALKVWQNGVMHSISDLVDGLEGQIGYAMIMNPRGEIVVWVGSELRLLIPVPSPGTCAALFTLGLVCQCRRARRGLDGSGV